MSSSGKQTNKSETRSVEPAFQYIFPIASDDGDVGRPICEPEVNGQLYLYHYGEDLLRVIQEKPAWKFHRNSHKIDVIIHSKEWIEKLKNQGKLLDEFVDNSPYKKWL